MHWYAYRTGVPINDFPVQICVQNAEHLCDMLKLQSACICNKIYFSVIFVCLLTYIQISMSVPPMLEKAHVTRTAQIQMVHSFAAVKLDMLSLDIIALVSSKSDKFKCLSVCTSIFV